MVVPLDILTLIEQGHQNAQDGLQRAVDHAERETPGWKDRCWALFLEWLDRMPVGFRFKVEDFRLHCEAQGLIEEPPSRRSFGMVAVKAMRAGLIESRGTVKVTNPKAHRANATMWEKV